MQPSRRYRSPARTAESARTRERIVGAAAGLLRSPEGAQRCTLESVAKAAGVTRLTVYNIFGSRSALFEAVFDQRAELGGLGNIALAMRNSDPRSAVEQLIATFVEFWASDQETLGNLYALGSADAEFSAVLRARNEGRYQAFTVLAARLAEHGDIRPDAADELIDVLFALTSYAFFADLTRHGRGSGDAHAHIIALARAELSRAGA
jgi:AcrR family transcriptional regulator